VFQGRSDRKPASYVPTWSRSRPDGPELLRSADDRKFEILPKPTFRTPSGDITITAIRAFTSFKGRLFAAPTGGSRGNVNGAGISLVYATDDPSSGNWVCVNEPGFWNAPLVVTCYELAALGDSLYAGTGGSQGFQIWRTTAEGRPPFRWERCLKAAQGAWR
jgi:hypothetical protein